MKITKLDINLNRQITLFEDSSKSLIDERSFYIELHNHIVSNQSIKGIEIEIPPMDIVCSGTEFFNAGKKFVGQGGIYFLYGEKRELLNIGSTFDLYDRIYKKLLGKNGGSKADYYFYHYYHSISLFLESNEYKRNVYEPYLINKLKSPLNYEYNYFDRSLYIELLKKEEEAAASSSSLFGYVSPTDY